MDRNWKFPIEWPERLQINHICASSYKFGPQIATQNLWRDFMELDMLSLHNWYALSGLMISAMYLPQTWQVVRSKTPLYEISIFTWGLWSTCLIVSFLYAALEIQDLKLSLVNLNGAFFCGVITATTYFKRKKYGVIKISQSPSEESAPRSA